MIRMSSFQEAFRSGKAKEVIDKFARVISRKIGSTISISPETYDYSNSYGNFTGYFGIIDEGDQMLRFNFKLGASDEIVSIDVYNSVTSVVPDLTVDTEGQNVIQILDIVVNILEGKKVERIKRGSKENILKGAEMEDFSSLMKMSAEDQYEQLNDYIYAVYKGISNSLIIYGPPGSGKTFTTRQELDRLGAKYEFFSGGLKGTAELVRLLYVFKDNTILVLDDFDSAMKSKEQQNILKTALQDDPVRRITYIEKTFGNRKKSDTPPTFEFTSAIIFITNEPKINPAIKSRSLNVKIDLSQEEILDKIRSVMDNLYPQFATEIKLKIWRFLKRAAKEKKIKRIDFRQFKFCLVTSAIVLDKFPSSTKWKKKCLAMLNA